MKTGYRPDPTVEHPSIGAICCHELPVGRTDIPRHISILTEQWPSRGGFLGGEYDAFQVGDPKRQAARRDLAGAGRARAGAGAGPRRSSNGPSPAGAGAASRRPCTARRSPALASMMTSEQLKAFDVSQEPAASLAEYGDTPFGRGCLAARRLIEVGVRCVEVTLGGWDTHVNNHEIHKARARVLDPAFAACCATYRGGNLLERTVVLCCGEFGRTPKVNPLGGRDHWPGGFSLAMAGGGIRGGLAIGQTDPEGTQGPRPADHDRGRARDRLDRPGPQPGQGEHRPGDRPADQAQRRQADPRPAGLSGVEVRSHRMRHGFRGTPDGK